MAEIDRRAGVHSWIAYLCMLAVIGVIWLVRGLLFEDAAAEVPAAEPGTSTIEAGSDSGSSSSAESSEPRRK